MQGGWCKEEGARKRVQEGGCKKEGARRRVQEGGCKKEGARRRVQKGGRKKEGARRRVQKGGCSRFLASYLQPCMDKPDGVGRPANSPILFGDSYLLSGSSPRLRTSHYKISFLPVKPTQHGQTTLQ